MPEFIIDVIAMIRSNFAAGNFDAITSDVARLSAAGW
jgi:hypothetical protein